MTTKGRTTAKRRRIAIVIDLEWNGKHHTHVFAGIYRHAQLRNWECVVWPHTPELQSESGKKAYDGIIARATPELAHAAKAMKIPLVNVWISSPVVDVPSVVPDMRAAGVLAGEHLLARGFSRFGYLGTQRARVSRQCEEGFRATVDDGTGDYTRHGVPLTFDSNLECWRRFQDRLATWAKTWTTPIGIFCVRDGKARYLCNIVQQIGLQIPADVGIVGCMDEENICLTPEPALSSIECGYERNGVRAAELLEELMDGGPAPTEPIRIAPVELIARTSTDAFAVEDPVVASALQFIASAGNRPLKVEDVVEQVPVGWRTLERRFHKLLGRTVSQEITRMRIERVKRLLVETKFPIKKVATECGFANASRLCKTFRQAEGTTPSEYRQRRTSD